MLLFFTYSCAYKKSFAVHRATFDFQADSKGEYLSAWHAGKVYSLFRKTPLNSPIPQQPDIPAGRDVSYLKAKTIF